MGSGVGKAAAGVKWGVAGRMVLAWVLTLPAAAGVAALIAAVTNHHGNAAIVVVAVVAAAVLAGVWLLSRKDAVTAGNVNDEGDYGDPQPVAAGAMTADVQRIHHLGQEQEQNR